MIFKGVCTALVTPFCQDGKIDYLALEKLIEFQIKNKVEAIVLLGTTGESSTIDKNERETLITFAKRIINKRIKLIIGTGCNNTAKAIKLTQQAEILGADACLVVSPYYNKCTQSGILAHYKQICACTNLPVIVYNVPSRTGVNILPETAKELCQISNVDGFKEANGNIDHILQLFSLVDKPIYCGNDNLNYIFHCLGATGTISVASNAYPQQVKLLFESFSNSKMLNLQLAKLCELLFVEPNPIPIKYILSKKGLIGNFLRLPLTPLSTKFHGAINQEMERLENLWKF